MHEHAYQDTCVEAERQLARVILFIHNVGVGEEIWDSGLSPCHLKDRLWPGPLQPSVTGLGWTEVWPQIRSLQSHAFLSPLFTRQSIP